ncbi:tol [Fusarium langsethiae]|uniref:Tol n=1 Tax=Fusarium langsethiae TaxID=179993 RepID=A0A0M9ELA0_FUSLA|nr:tol [Fusarium langsethiae]
MQPGKSRVFYLCSDIGPPEAADDQIQLGFPVLSHGDHPWRFSLLRAWLERCKTKHACRGTQHRSKRELPTRLLKIGDNRAPNMLRLVSSQTLKQAEYVALSHRWGETVPGEVPSYCTINENVDKRENGFLIDDLPATFQDAIEVTRQLELQHTWLYEYSR